MPCSLVGNSRIATGTSAIAGIGRTHLEQRLEDVGAAQRDRASRMPSPIPATDASAKPVRMRIRLWARSW